MTNSKKSKNNLVLGMNIDFSKYKKILIRDKDGNAVVDISHDKIDVTNGYTFQLIESDERKS